MTEQQRKEAYANWLNEQFQIGVQQFGFRPKIRLVTRVFDGGEMEQTEAILDTEAVAGWQPPKEEKG